MQQITRKAYAKINLTLDVTGKLPNGYHTVRMLMQSVGLHDDVTITRREQEGVSLSCDKPFVPTDARNLAVRAAALFFAETGITPVGLHIDLVKRIPVAAGLAGGSTDAAAVLHGMNEMFGTALSLDRLCEIGLKLGADIPYCLRGGTMLAEGIGEQLTPAPSMPPCKVVLCKPDFPVSTAEVYAKMNGGNLPERPDTAGMLRALEKRDYAGICHRLYNVMERVISAQHAEIGQIRDILLTCGADGAVMSGSGPTTYGLFSDPVKAEAAYQTLRQQFADTHLTEVLV